MRSFIASLLAFAVLLLLIVGVLAVKLDSQTEIKDHSWLHIDLYGEVLEYDPPGDLMSEVTGGDALTLQKVLENLAKAAVDERIDGVILQMSATHNAGPAKLQEIRGAIKRLQAAGKPVYGYADAMDAPTYYLAAACDSLYCPPSAYIGFRGFGRTTTHVKKMLEKLGVQEELHAIRHYKAAAQLVNRENLTPEVKKNQAWMLDERWQVFCADLAADRGLGEDDINALMERALFTADEAVDAGLFDRLLYWDELERRLKQDGDKRLRRVANSRYAEEDPADLDLGGDKKIAVIHAQGNIGGRTNSVNPMLGLMMGHETIVNELLRALNDDDVVAIVFRVDSGGGDSLTSDLIGHAVGYVSQTKPVIVSMVDMAASGGYSISYRGSKLMADPLSITGSIGSISGKFSLAGLYEKIGVTTDRVGIGPRAHLMASDRPFTAEEAELYARNHWQDFRNWMNDVAAHRGIAAADIDSLCMGRVWTGRQAVANKLIDATGGQYEAVALAKAEAGLAAEEKVTLWHLPESQDLLASVFGGGEDEMSVAVRASRGLKWALYRELRQEAATTIRQAGVADGGYQGAMWVIDPALRP